MEDSIPEECIVCKTKWYKHFGVPENLFVVDTPDEKNREGGLNRLYKRIIAELNRSDLITLGVVIDADQDLNKRWQEMRKTFLRAGYTLPEEPPIDGLIWEQRDKKIGAWVMPDNISSGVLEHFIMELIPEDDLLRDEVEKFLTTIEENKLQRYKQQHRVKSFVHIWLACQNPPGQPYGLSISSKNLDADKPLARRFEAWLRRLFE